jgi:hypothetical protein
MSFKVYIAKRRVTHAPTGDFVADAKRDPTLPDSKTWAELEAYLFACHASDAAVEAGKKVWRQYCRQR